MSRSEFTSWTLYNAFGFLISLGAVDAVVLAMQTWLLPPETVAERALTIVALLGAGTFEGLLVGTMQWQVLKRRVQQITWSRWAGFTLLASLLCWLVGILPYLLIRFGPFRDDVPVQNFFQHPWLPVFVVGGMLFLAWIRGYFQAVALSTYVRRGQHWWAIFNTPAWFAGYGALLVGVIFFQDAESTVAQLGILLGTTVVGGFLLGVISAPALGKVRANIKAVYKEEEASEETPPAAEEED